MIITDKVTRISGIELPPIPSIKIKISDFQNKNKFNKFKNYLLHEDPHITGFEIETSETENYYSLMLFDLMNNKAFQLVVRPEDKEFVIYPFEFPCKTSLNLLFKKITMFWGL